MQQATKPASQRSAAKAECGLRHPHGPTPEEWSLVKDVIRQLYVIDQLPLKEVKQHLEHQFNFHATERMYKARLGPWGFNKNSKNKDWGAIAKLHKMRKESGKSATEFMVHGKRRTLAQLRKHIMSKSMTEQQFLEAAWDIEIPAYVRCYTPDPEDTSSACPSTNPPTSEDLHLPLSEAEFDKASFTSSTPHTSSQVPVASLLVQQAGTIHPLSERDQRVAVGTAISHDLRTRPSLDRPRNSRLSSGLITVPSSQSRAKNSASASTPCQHLQSQLNKMARQALAPSAEQQVNVEDPEPWVILTNLSDDAEVGAMLNHCSECHQSISSHLNTNTLDDFVFLEQSSDLAMSSCSSSNVSHSDEHLAAALKWVVRCFSACISMTYGTSMFAEQSLLDAEREVEDMLASDNPLTLTSLNLILSILHMHDQGQIVEAIVGSALKVARKVLGYESPITVTIDWMTAAAGQKLPQPGLDANALDRVYQYFTQQLGESHPHSITALYNLSWNLITDGEWEAAERNLRRLHRISQDILGPSHMQSITALTSLSRSLSNQNKTYAAIKTMQEAIDRSESTIGPSHPYNLESKRRLALMFDKVNDKPQMEALYWDVLKGRLKMLGRTHPYTIGAKVDLVRLLQDLGKWNERGPVKEAIEALFEQQGDPKANLQAF